MILFYLVISSAYELCEILKGEHYNNTHHCPMEIAASSPDFECSCPFHPGTYKLNPTTVVIPKLNALYGWLALVKDLNIDICNVICEKVARGTHVRHHA